LSVSSTNHDSVKGKGQPAWTEEVPVARLVGDLR
jgi:hypothetical protein